MRKKTEGERGRTEHKLACCVLNESVRAGWTTVSVECADIFDFYYNVFFTPVMTLQRLYICCSWSWDFVRKGLINSRYQDQRETVSLNILVYFHFLFFVLFCFTVKYQNCSECMRRAMFVCILALDCHYDNCKFFSFVVLTHLRDANECQELSFLDNASLSSSVGRCGHFSYRHIASLWDRRYTILSYMGGWGQERDSLYLS